MLQVAQHAAEAIMQDAARIMAIMKENAGGDLASMAREGWQLETYPDNDENGNCDLRLQQQQQQ